MVAAVAAEDPETAANIPLPRILTWSNRPGRWTSQGESPENISSDRRERKRISPIQTNSGRAARDQELLAPQTVVASTSPSGASVNRAIPITPTPSREKATQIPLPRKRNRTTSKTRVILISDITN